MGYSDTKHSCFILVCSDFPFYIVQAVPSDLIPAPLGQSVRAERRADRYHATTGSSVRSGTLRLGGGLASDNMGVSENRVPLNPMVNDHYPVFKWLFHWEYTLFSDKPMYIYMGVGQN